VTSHGYDYLVLKYRQDVGDAAEDPPGELAQRAMLAQNFPNPFNPLTSIYYEVYARSRVLLRVFDLLGREVATLVDELQERGARQVRFYRGDLPSGIYVYSLRVGGDSQTRKMVLLR
jgi:hypothetical protein